MATLQVFYSSVDVPYNKHRLPPHAPPSEAVASSPFNHPGEEAAPAWLVRVTIPLRFLNEQHLPFLLS